MGRFLIDMNPAKVLTHRLVDWRLIWERRTRIGDVQRNERFPLSTFFATAQAIVFADERMWLRGR